MLQYYKAWKREEDELMAERRENIGVWPSEEHRKRWLGCAVKASELKKELEAFGIYV